MILVTAAARLRPDTRKMALAAAAEMQEATAREPGCHEYRFWVAIDDPDSVLVFERWADQASLDAHFAAQHTRDFGAAIASYADGPVAVTRFEVAHAGPLR
jgi:quinol monooxygenase YgiN